MEDAAAIGDLLKKAMNQYYASDKKYRDLHLGMIAAYKNVLDVCGEGRFARQVIDETVTELEGGKQGKKQQGLFDLIF